MLGDVVAEGGEDLVLDPALNLRLQRGGHGDVHLLPDGPGLHLLLVDRRGEGHPARVADVLGGSRQAADHAAGRLEALALLGGAAEPARLVVARLGHLGAEHVKDKRALDGPFQDPGAHVVFNLGALGYEAHHRVHSGVHRGDVDARVVSLNLAQLGNLRLARLLDPEVERQVFVFADGLTAEGLGALGIHAVLRRLRLQALQEVPVPGLDVGAELSRRELARLHQPRLEADVLNLHSLQLDLRLFARGRQLTLLLPEALVHATLPGGDGGAVLLDVVHARRRERSVHQVVISRRHHRAEQRGPALGLGDVLALLAEALDHATLARIDRRAQSLGVVLARLAQVLVESDIVEGPALVLGDGVAALLAHLLVVRFGLQAHDHAAAARGYPRAQHLPLGRALGGQPVLVPPVARHPELAGEEFVLARLGRLLAVGGEAGPQPALARLDVLAVLHELVPAREGKAGVLSDVIGGGDHGALHLGSAGLVLDLLGGELGLQALQHAAAGAHLGLGSLHRVAAQFFHRRLARLLQLKVEPPVGGPAHAAAVQNGATLGAELGISRVGLQALHHPPLAGLDVRAESLLISAALLGEESVKADILALLNLAAEHLELALGAQLLTLVLEALLGGAAAPLGLGAELLPVILAHQRERRVQGDVLRLLNLPRGHQGLAVLRELLLVGLEAAEHQTEAGLDVGAKLADVAAPELVVAFAAANLKELGVRADVAEALGVRAADLFPASLGNGTLPGEHVEREVDALGLLGGDDVGVEAVKVGLELSVHVPGLGARDQLGVHGPFLRLLIAARGPVVLAVDHGVGEGVDLSLEVGDPFVLVLLGSRLGRNTRIGALRLAPVLLEEGASRGGAFVARHGLESIHHQVRGAELLDISLARAGRGDIVAAREGFHSLALSLVLGRELVVVLLGVLLVFTVAALGRIAHGGEVAAVSDVRGVVQVLQRQRGHVQQLLGVGALGLEEVEIGRRGLLVVGLRGGD